MENSPSPASISMLARRLRAALAGGPPVFALPSLRAAAPPAGTALVVRTSGSTGTPREVAIGAAALVASAAATHERLGGPGRWVLALPATHIAGLQVVVRSLLAADAGVDDALVADGDDVPPRFTPDALGDLVSRALVDDVPVHVSLVPTQLHRVLAAADDGHRAGLDALTQCSSVLLGGAATPPPLLARAASAGVRVVRTYGMSETSGGCVYDGMALPGVRVRLAPTGGGVGVVELSGPMLASGYVGDPAATARAFRTDDDGVRWFRTSDLGALHAAHDDGGDGAVLLRVLGRADDVIVTGGVNVTPAAVEAVLAEVLPDVLAAGRGTAAVESCVVGVPDDEWGQRVVAVVAVLAPGSPPGSPEPGRLTPLGPALLAQVRAAVTARLGAPSAPREVFVTGALPSRGPGKIDRRSVARAAADAAGVDRAARPTTATRHA